MHTPSVLHPRHIEQAVRTHGQRLPRLGRARQIEHAVPCGAVILRQEEVRVRGRDEGGAVRTAAKGLELWAVRRHYRIKNNGKKFNNSRM